VGEVDDCPRFLKNLRRQFFTVRNYVYALADVESCVTARTRIRQLGTGARRGRHSTWSLKNFSCFPIKTALFTLGLLLVYMILLARELLVPILYPTTVNSGSSASGYFEQRC